MVCKIIFLLPCFTVLVNAAGGSHGCMISCGKPFSTIDQWAASLTERTISDWTTLSQDPSDDQKRSLRAALNSTACPDDDLDNLLSKSHVQNWPDNLKTGNTYNIYIVNNLRFREVKGVPVLYAGPMDNGSDVVPAPGILLIFDRLR